MKNILRFIS